MEQNQIHALFAGFALGSSFILSLGPQNLFVMRAGVTRHHALTVATTAFVSELFIVTSGVVLVGTLTIGNGIGPSTLKALGVVFLLIWGWRTLRSEAVSRHTVVCLGGRRQAMTSILLLTWFNPLVYVEAMLLVGVLAGSFGESMRPAFAVGFLVASAVKFYGWSAAGMMASGLLHTPRHHLWLDRVSGGIMIALGLALAMQFAATGSTLG